MMITKQQFDSNMKTSPQQVQQQLKSSNAPYHCHNKQQHERCFICFKLVKNLKGNKLSHFYDLNALVNETNFTYSSPQNGETNLQLENNQDVNNNNTNLVNNNNTNRIKSGDLFKFKRKQQQQTIGENILKTLKRTAHLNKSTKIEILLNDNLVYMKKICENCFKQINSIDYHLNNAFKLCDQMSFKLAKSHRLVRTMQRRNSFKKLNGLLKRKTTQHDSDLVNNKKSKCSDSTKNGYSQQSRKVGIPTSSSSSSTSSLSSLSVSSNQNGQIKLKDDFMNKSLKLKNSVKEEPSINKQEEQDMSSSRRKRKSINPSRLLKEHLESIKTEVFQPQVQLLTNNHHHEEEDGDEVEEDEEEEEIVDKLNNIPNYEHKKTHTKAVNNTTNNTNNSHKTNNSKPVINTNGKKSLNSNKIAAESLLSLSVLSKLSPTTPPTPNNIPKTNNKVFNNKTDNSAYNKDILLSNLLKLNKNPTVAAAQAALIDKLLLNSNNKENDNKLIIKNESDNKQEYVDDNEDQYDDTEEHIPNGNDYHLEDEEEEEEEIIDEDEEVDEIDDEEQHINSEDDNEGGNDENENYSDNFMNDYQSCKQSAKQNKSNGFTPTKKQNNQLNAKSLKSKKASSSFYSNNLFDENSNQSNKNPNYLQSPRMSISSNGSHLNTKHACEVCKKTFKTQNILRQHMRIHTGDKPFVCEICNKAFSQMASLKYHLATHSDARPYRCETCSKTFKLKPPFKKHIKECQPRHNSNQQQQQALSNSPSNASSSSFYYNSNALNMNSSGLDLDLNEDDE